MVDMDKIDIIIAQWRVERPDLEQQIPDGLVAMALIGRLKNASMLINDKLEKVFFEFGLSAGEFDVLAALLRSGKPYTLSPTKLYQTMMITSGTMTHRLKLLEKQGLITRIANPDDSRSLLVVLSPSGHALINQAIAVHMANESAILTKLNDDEKQALDKGLRALARVLGVCH